MKCRVCKRKSGVRAICQKCLDRAHNEAVERHNRDERTPKVQTATTSHFWDKERNNDVR